MKKRKTWPKSPYGRWVHRELLEREMTVRELCRLTGICETNMSQWLHGRRAGQKYRPLVEQVLGAPPAEVGAALDKLAG